MEDQELMTGSVGRKNSAQLFHVFIILRIVSGLDFRAIGNLAIRIEHQVSDFSGLAVFSRRYSSRQSSYLASVLRFWASRFSVLGMYFFAASIGLSINRAI